MISGLIFLEMFTPRALPLKPALELIILATQFDLEV
jgi:hypothetical protein